MKKTAKEWLQLIPKPKRYTTVILLLIVGVALIDSIFVAVSSDLRTRNYLEGRASTIAAALPVEDIKTLKASKEDLNNPAYVRLKQRIVQIKQENDDTRFVYIMGKKGEQLFFYTDSEQPGSPGYSAPGEEFSDGSQRLKDEFQSYMPFVEGPVRDKYGWWISAVAPVVDPKTNTVVAVAGIDLPAVDYYRQIALLAMVPLLLAAIPVAGLMRDRKIAKKEWEIANLKSQFVSIASHELRSPMTGMLWAIQSLLGNKVTNITAPQKVLLQDMYRSTEFSVATINEILDLSIFERGKKNDESEVIDLVDVLRSAQTTLSLGAQEKNIDIVMAKTWPDSAYTKGNVASLKRAYMNILSNAIKYSFESSTITIAYRQEGKEHVIGVLDRGIGIPKSEQEKVFGGYYRAANAEKAQAHGTGLGLFVTKLIIEQHNGRIWVDSEENKGTTLYTALAVTQKPSKKA